jgi:hypothetical protein
LRLVVPSACWKASKISCCLLRAMPMPVSATANAMTPPSRSDSFATASPAWADCMRSRTIRAP